MDRLPNQPNLDHLRQQAKDLLREQRAAGSDDELRLSKAQRELARRYGFGSWTALKRVVDRFDETEKHLDLMTWPNTFDPQAISWELIHEGALRHPSPVVRRRCLDLLDHHGDDTIGPTVVRALDDPIPRVRRHALHALTCVKCRVGALAVDVVASLVRVALEDPNEKVRLQAVDSLGRFAPHDERARAALEKVRANDASVIVAEAAGQLLENPRVRYQGSMKVQRRRQRATSTAFVQQTTVDRLVELALNSVDKPDFLSSPTSSVNRVVERYGVEPVNLALARCRQLFDANPADFTAAGAVKFLEEALTALEPPQ